MSVFELIRAEAAEFPIARLCALLGVSPSGGKPTTQRPTQPTHAHVVYRNELAQRQKHHHDLFKQHAVVHHHQSRWAPIPAHCGHVGTHDAAAAWRGKYDHTSDAGVRQPRTRFYDNAGRAYQPIDVHWIRRWRWRAAHHYRSSGPRHDVLSGCGGARYQRQLPINEHRVRLGCRW
jgi:hypothetical protein